MKIETIDLMIDKDKCYIPLDSLQNAVSNSLFEIVKRQEEELKKYINKIIKQNEEINRLKREISNI